MLHEGLIADNPSQLNTNRRLQHEARPERTCHTEMVRHLNQQEQQQQQHACMH